MRAPARSVLGATVVLLLLGCGGGGSTPPPPAGAASPAQGDEPLSSADAGGSISEAERTREMEARAAEMRRALEEARASGASGEEAAEAWEKYEQERAELNRVAEGEQAVTEGESYSPPPPGD